MADDPGEQASPTARAQTFDVDSPTAGRVVQMAPVGALVEAGAEVAVVEVMKMEHAVTTAAGGRVKEICAAAGDVVEAGQRLLVVVTERLPDAPDTGAPGVGSAIRGDLEETRRRHARLMDSARPKEVGRRHA
ncbi:MAG: acetyl-CoA carboxylase biotin carboxyl carrier protein subunit, partial [Acidimicrobiaceae bacterium]|nr:acetyl-CoA carboxylase biotin carboxyl carrier protein subunit [Acidimicrobiaceae bacterium]